MVGCNGSYEICMVLSRPVSDRPLLGERAIGRGLDRRVPQAMNGLTSSCGSGSRGEDG